MTGYRDMTFCDAKCSNAECSRKLTPAVSEAAERWWGQPGAPIWMEDYSSRCPVYQPPRTET